MSDFAHMVEPLSCGGWGYRIFDHNGDVVSWGGSQTASQAQANAAAQRILAGLRWEFRC